MTGGGESVGKQTKTKTRRDFKCSIKSHRWNIPPTTLTPLSLFPSFITLGDGVWPTMRCAARVLRQDRPGGMRTPSWQPSPRTRTLLVLQVARNDKPRLSKLTGRRASKGNRRDSRHLQKRIGCTRDRPPVGSFRPSLRYPHHPLVLFLPHRRGMLVRRYGLDRSHPLYSPHLAMSRISICQSTVHQ